MERKRKLPARAARVEAVSKKRMSTPPDQRTQTPVPPAPPPVVEESLPKSIAPGKPLPTLEVPQAGDLSSREFQSISESGVLSESLKRSRQKWISEGIFEKYWTKVAKKKAADLANNPAKDTMTKLGTCTITVEPHIIDAVMYAIKEPARPAPPSTPQQPMYRPPIIQYGPPNGMMPPPPPPPPASVAPQQKQSPQATSQTFPTSQHTPAPNSGNAGLPTAHTPSTPTMSRAAPNGQPYSSPNQNPNVPPPATTPGPSSSGKSTDPVIQMLAERAATDPDLKALMRIVANGTAKPEELKRFQNHIDDLTRLQKARQAAAQAQQTSRPQHQHPVQPSVSHMNGNARPLQSPAQSPGPHRTGPTPPPQLPYQPQPQQLRSKGPLPPSKPDISGVVFEFTGGSGDRFLFPKFSILEYLPHGQVIASFLIVRKGSSSDSPTYDPQLDYYQPITIRLYAHQGRQLDALQKVVAPPDEVRRYMDDIMDNMTRAEYVLLAMCLPRDTDHKSVEKVEKEAEPAKINTQMDNQVLWATTNSTPPAKPVSLTTVKAGERLLTEEEKYQSFIASVST